MTTNYKTSFLLPNDYEIPTFNYPQYLLPPVPCNYQVYIKDIIPANAKLPISCKFIVLPQCKTSQSRVNLFDDIEEYRGYYEVEIDLKQIYPKIQSISKFQDAYKTIEISNLNNFSIVNNGIKISDYNYSNKEIIFGNNKCHISAGEISEFNIM